MSDGGISFILALAISIVLLGMQPPITQAVDYRLMHRFYKFYLRTTILSGELPLWNPYIALGRPFLADSETATFYPPNWIFILLPETPALFGFLTFHFWLAAFFVIKLARRWGAPHIAAIVLAFVWLASGPVLGRLEGGLLGYFCGLAYWPCLFYLAERLRERLCWQHWMALVVAVSGSFLGGHPQCFWLIGVALSLYLVGAHLESPWPKNALRCALCLGALAGAYAFALLLCAVQLLPTVDLALQGNRTEPSIGFSSYLSMGWASLTSFFVSQPIMEGWPDSNLHIGVICTLAGLIGLGRWRDVRVRGLWLMGAVGFVLALGQRTPLFVMMFHILPGMGLFRVPGRYATFSVWALLMAAVIAWRDGRVPLRKAMAVLILLMAGTAYVIWAGDEPGHSALVIAVLLTGLALLAVWHSRCAVIVVGPAGRSMLLALICINSAAGAVDMWSYYQHGGVSRKGAKIADAGAKMVDILQKKNLYLPNGVPPRLFVPSYFAQAGGDIKYSFSSVAGYGALTSMRVWSYLYAGTGLPVEFLQNTYLSNDAYRAGPFPFPGMNIVAGWRNGSPGGLFFNPHPGERAYLIYAWEQVPDWASALRRMVRDHVDPMKLALLEAPATGPAVTAGDVDGNETVIDAFHRNSIEMHVRSPQPALLIVAEAWYPGWRATVNGVPAEVLPANVWMRAVRVPAGESRVKMYYLEPSLALGAAISLGALLVLAAVGWRLHRKKLAASGGLP